MTVVVIKFSKLWEREARELAEYARKLGFHVILEEGGDGFRVETPYGVFYRLRDAKEALKQAAVYDEELRR